mmetsp:Transcript_49285/g.145535  ORF Transcript_49285/g.145535 Transcript_49285/m.145535 type:complete len:244 (+) Transcript_49285:279-1010(+)
MSICTCGFRCSLACSSSVSASGPFSFSFSSSFSVSCSRCLRRCSWKRLRSRACCLSSLAASLSFFSRQRWISAEASTPHRKTAMPGPRAASASSPAPAPPPHRRPAAGGGLWSANVPTAGHSWLLRSELFSHTANVFVSLSSAAPRSRVHALRGSEHFVRLTCPLPGAPMRRDASESPAQGQRLQTAFLSGRSAADWWSTAKNSYGVTSKCLTERRLWPTWALTGSATTAASSATPSARTSKA